MGSLITALGSSSRALFEALGVPTRLQLISSGRLARLTSLLALFSRSDEGAESLLAEKFSQLQIVGDLSEYESRALDRLRDLMSLRYLTFAKVARNKNRLRQGFVIRSVPEFRVTDESLFAFSIQDVTESATIVADLYWKLFDACQGTIPELRPVALQLYASIFGVPFRLEIAKAKITRMTDNIQRELGIPFLVFNLVRQGAIHEAREVGRHLVTEGIEFAADEEMATVLYWFAEIFWFQQAWGSEKLNHETTLRFLYHLCFTAPDRAGFLEIDSAFFSEFEIVSELAREAFTYRETLVDRLLRLWEVYEGDFDPLFQKALEAVAGRTSKIYDQRSSWEKLWKRSQESFSRDYLYVVEGNLCFATGAYREAADCFETALSINPHLRPALLNLLFAYAKLGRVQEHQVLVKRVLGESMLLPSSLYVVGNSFLLLGDEAMADHYYEQLRAVPGWSDKTDHYKSTFCFQNKLYPQALHYARLAYALNPTDTAMIHHLSLCFHAVGAKDQALEMLRQVPPTAIDNWLHFYQFTLERDLGHHGAASETLLKIPSDYFEDPEELEAALAYAKGQQDLGLLRHLKKKKSLKD